MPTNPRTGAATMGIIAVLMSLASPDAVGELPEFAIVLNDRIIIKTVTRRHKAARHSEIDPVASIHRVGRVGVSALLAS